MRNAELPGKGRARHDAYRYTPHSAFRIPHFYLMRRVLIVSPTYLNPANRGKLRALAARDLDVTVGVPERSREAALGRTVEVGWERQNGVEVFPIPVRHWAHAAEAPFGTRCTKGSRSDTWAAWCRRRDSILCSRPSPKTGVGAGTSGWWATVRIASDWSASPASCGWRHASAGQGRCPPTR